MKAGNFRERLRKKKGLRATGHKGNQHGRPALGENILGPGAGINIKHLLRRTLVRLIRYSAKEGTIRKN
ncbi:hypothetical protein [Longitalea arenae]|uniref:hypothetical protein n=1 Tax=Longitalea arenae TaxID=2812558 RepID=UPI00196840E3|nr:hypothetical protein [Longitalea arenae]